MFSKVQLMQQLRLSYLLIPTILYFLMFSLNTNIQTYIFGRTDSLCIRKNEIVNFDLFLFEKLYEETDKSMNVIALFILGVPYLAHFIVPVIYISYIFIKRKGWKVFWTYLFSLSITSMIVVIIQNIYPTPPPWIFLNLPSTGKFYIVDEHLPIPIFKLIYGANSLICGAFPSLHVGWPTVLTAVEAINIYLGVIYVIWLAIAAVYSNHHWITDVIAGIFLSILLSLICKLIIRKIFIKKELQKNEQIQKIEEKDNDKNYENNDGPPETNIAIAQINRNLQYAELQQYNNTLEKGLLSKKIGFKKRYRKKNSNFTKTTSEYYDQ